MERTKHADRILRSVFTLGVLLLTTALAKPAWTQEAYVTTSTVNVRKGPGTNYPTIAKIAKGTRVQIVGREGDWLKVESKHGNPPGYIAERFAVRGQDQSRPTAAAASGTYVTTATVNVRRGPGAKYGVISKIPKNTKVQVVAAEGEWLKVESKHGNPPGYIQRSYARPTSTR